MCSGKFFAGLVVGAVAGIVAGILYAPTSGEETRKKIIEGSSEACVNTEEYLKELQDKANSVMEDIQRKSDELLKKIQEKI